MVIGTTPTFTLTITDDDTLNFFEVETIFFTIKQGSVQYTKSGSDITIIAENSVAATLSQEETLSFKSNVQAEIQLNWTYENGSRAATRVKRIDLSKNLLREVLQ